jgi:hypothetical protein
MKNTTETGHYMLRIRTNPGQTLSIDSYLPKGTYYFGPVLHRGLKFAQIPDHDCHIYAGKFTQEQLANLEQTLVKEGLLCKLNLQSPFKPFLAA